VADASLSSPISGAAPLTVQFDGSRSTDDVRVDSYLWDFGDGNSGAGVRVGHQYTTPGTYTAELVVVDDENVTSTADAVTIVVGVNQAPTARMTFLSGSTSGTAPFTLRMNAANATDPEGETLTYLWNFGEQGSTSTTFESVHTYNTAGIYTLSLRVEDTQGNAHTTTQTITVQSAFDVVEAYNNQCASCHGANGEGASAPALTRATTLQALIDDVNRMPPGGELDCRGQANCDELMAQYILDNFSATPGDIGFQCDAQATQVATHIRRLSKDQYENTLRDLLARRLSTAQVNSVMAAVENEITLIPNDRTSHDFDILDSRMSNTHVERYFAASVAVADTIASDANLRNALVGSCSANSGDVACRTAFVDWFGLRTHRRPLESATRVAYQAITDYRTLIAVMSAASKS